MRSAAVHHMARVQPYPGGPWEVARPLRDTSRWHQWRAERHCARTLGHCWHPAGDIDWWCCSCAADTDGIPPLHRCRHCTRIPHITGEAPRG